MSELLIYIVLLPQTVTNTCNILRIALLVVYKDV